MWTETYNCSHCENYTTIWPFAFFNHQRSCKSLSTQFSCEETLEMYECEKCGFAAHFKIDYDSHVNLKSHSKYNGFGDELNKDQFICERCNFNTFSKYFFAVHQSKVSCWSTVTHDGRMKCKVCDKIIKKRGCFKLHVHYKHSGFIDMKNSFCCPHCPYTTKYKQSLQFHVICRHMDPDYIKWFECPQCSYKCKLKWKLTLHIRRLHHRSMKQLSCDQCPYTTKAKDYLCEHVSDLYKCDHCSFESKFKKGITMHCIAKHSDLTQIEWFSCELCPYKSNAKRNLTRHMKDAHTPADQMQWYKCEQCDYKSKYNYMLKQHLKRHVPTEGKRFYCDKCTYKTDWKGNFQRHFQLRHSDQ